jgi:hypothetical protein
MHDIGSREQLKACDWFKMLEKKGTVHFTTSGSSADE